MVELLFEAFKNSPVSHVKTVLSFEGYGGSRLTPRVVAQHYFAPRDSRKPMNEKQVREEVIKRLTEAGLMKSSSATKLPTHNSNDALITHEDEFAMLHDEQKTEMIKGIPHVIFYNLLNSKKIHLTP